jgi:glycosyltransferase involved in cell wall biosynthesis
VSGWIPASSDSTFLEVSAALPGLADLEQSRLNRRQIAAMWQYGFTRLGTRSATHAPSLLAPLTRHDRTQNPRGQVVTTIHDAVPWTHPATLTPRGVSWHRAMAQRAERYADAIVVPTDAVADELRTVLNLGDRVRVIAGAVSQDLAAPSNAHEIRRRLGLPSRYITAVGTIEPRKGIGNLMRALARIDAKDLKLVHVGPQGWGGLDLNALADSADLSRDRVLGLGFLSDNEVAAVMQGAAVFVMPSQAEGFGLPLLEAMSLGTPAIHTDVPALIEVARGAGLVVKMGPHQTLDERLADAIVAVLDDGELAHSLRLRGLDRAQAYSWNDSAKKTWQLHADL